MTTPLISVLIDTYNHEKYIEQAVMSAIGQDFPASDYEILVVDDGSTDRTAEIVRKFAPRVRLLSKMNGGQASAFNAAVPETRGRIVAFLDGDDWFAAGKLAAVAKALEENPDIAAVGHGYYDFDDATREIRVCVPTERKIVHLTTPERAREAMKGWQFVLMGALTARRKMLDRIMPLPQQLAFCADMPISWGCAAGGILLLPEAMFYYRHHPNNLFAPGRAKSEQIRQGFEMVEKAYAATQSLLARLGIRKDSTRALLHPPWVGYSRSSLATFGGSRLRTFRTEMWSFHVDFASPSLRYQLFKYLIVAPATLLLPPRNFYRMREWYAKRSLMSVRERLAKSSTDEHQQQLPVL